MRVSDTILGAVTTSAVGAGIGWVIDSPVIGIVSTFSAFGLAAIGWWIRKGEKEDNAARNKWVADAIANMQVSLVNVQVNQVITADMMQRLHATMHPEPIGAQPTVVLAVPEAEKKP